MIKKLFIILFGIAFIVACFHLRDNAFPENVEKEGGIAESGVTATVHSEPKQELRGVWLTYKELGSLIRGKKEHEFREAAERVMRTCRDSGVNTVFYHGRAFCDALYCSGIFPLSIELDIGMDFDPLKIFIEEAEKQDVDIHLWINPYRVSYNNSIGLLPENSPAVKLYKNNKKSLLICQSGIYLNPANEESRALVLKGIREILDGYQVKGIHFDDYFYPQEEKLGDEKQYKEYQKSGGRLSLADWRRENVNALISGAFSLVKSYDDDILFSISPAGDIGKCKDIFFADVEKWLKEDGFADYIIPQLYFGFENEKAPFKKLSEEWEKAAGESGKLILGMSPYKCGKEDKNAGDGRLEWVERDDVLKRQYEYIGYNACWNGFVLFSYSYCFGENVNDISEKEIKSLSDMIK